MVNQVQDLLDLLNLEQIEQNIFRGTSRETVSGAIFGGQVLGQALAAAGRTVEGRIAHSMHGYFLRSGDMKAPVVFEVDRIRDGTSFTTRRVVAIQHGQPIFNMAASFQIEEPGVDHQFDMPKVTQPEDLVSEGDMRKMFVDYMPEKLRTLLLQDQPIEIRVIDPINPFAPEARPPYRMMWFKAAGKLPDDLAIHQNILAYASDHGFISTSFLPHKLTFTMRNLQVASLDHALWFHRPFRADEWLLYTMDSPSASNARGLNRGSIYTREGVLVASVAQEGLIRVRPETKRPEKAVPKA